MAYYVNVSCALIYVRLRIILFYKIAILKFLYCRVTAESDNKDTLHLLLLKNKN